MRPLALVVAVFCCTNYSARAQTVESCKTCRDHNRVCLQNYSQATCKSEYDVCMKHCREK